MHYNHPAATSQCSRAACSLSAGWVSSTAISWRSNQGLRLLGVQLYICIDAERVCTACQRAASRQPGARARGQIQKIYPNAIVASGVAWMRLRVFNTNSASIASTCLPGVICVVEYSTNEYQISTCTNFFRADSIARRDASSKVSHSTNRRKLEFSPL
jgi:hypothetical protein